MDGGALVIGESLVDIVRTADGVTTERPGGSAANVAVALARLGRSVRFVTAYADDERGHAIARHLADSGVELAGDPQVLPRTSSAMATIQPGGSATYSFDLDWRLGPVTVGSPQFVHVCSLGAVVQPGADDVLGILAEVQDSATISYDVNARPAVTGTGPDLVAAVERVAAVADIVKASDEDLAVLYPTFGLAEAAEHLLALGPRAIALTLGEGGATWITATGEVTVESNTVTVVDTIGAGDTFAAALVDALWDDIERDPAEVLAHAARAAAITVSRPGADPPYRHELG
ncbi:MAG: PfkB family carbohydrate kinase [Actinomycetota bacterium]|nr:PfkB family carbohydrate kinase [Actinomycetota bacterium]